MYLIYDILKSHALNSQDTWEEQCRYQIFSTRHFYLQLIGTLRSIEFQVEIIDFFQLFLIQKLNQNEIMR